MFKIIDWNIEAMTGYKPISTFYADFSIADRFGIEAIRETFNDSFKGWKHDYKMVTELCMALNWKIWEHYEHNETYAKIYDGLWRNVCRWIEENLKGEELAYYYRTTD